MEELLKSVYAQAGAFGLLAISGWLMWWFERTERVKIQAKRDELLEIVLKFMSEQKDMIEKISDGLAFQSLLRDEFNKYRDRYERDR